MKTSVEFQFTNTYGDTYSEVVSLAQFRKIWTATRSPKFMHARARNTLSGYPSVLIYHRDGTSPTGRLLAAGGPAFIVDRLLRKHRNTSALSPFEMLGS